MFTTKRVEVLKELQPSVEDKMYMFHVYQMPVFTYICRGVNSWVSPFRPISNTTGTERINSASQVVVAASTPKHSLQQLFSLLRNPFFLCRRRYTDNDKDFSAVPTIDSRNYLKSVLAHILHGQALDVMPS